MKKKYIYLETTIGNCNELSLLNHDFISKFVYRGQADASWILSSSLERLVMLYHPYALSYFKILDYYGQKNLEEFKWKYPVYGNTYVPQEGDTLGWLAIMQHYGSPTRMVDFTYSPYIALFFAINNSSAEKCAIWCLNHHVYEFSLYEKYSKNSSEGFINPFEFNQYIYDQVNDRLNGRVIIDHSPEIYLIRPRQINERLCRQQGLFAIPGDMEKSFMDNVFSKIQNTDPQEISFKDIIAYSSLQQGRYKQADIALVKINVPIKLRFEITCFLREMNISAETLFSDLEGLAKAVALMRMNI